MFYSFENLAKTLPEECDRTIMSEEPFADEEPFAWFIHLNVKDYYFFLSTC